MGHPPAGHLLVKVLLLHRGSCPRSAAPGSPQGHTRSHRVIPPCTALAPPPAPCACTWCSPKLPNVLSVSLCSPQARRLCSLVGATSPPGVQGLGASVSPRPTSRGWSCSHAEQGSGSRGASPPRCQEGSGLQERLWPGPRLFLASEGDQRAREAGERPVAAREQTSWHRPEWGPDYFKWCIFTASYSGAHTGFLHQVLGAHKAGGLEITDHTSTRNR